MSATEKNVPCRLTVSRIPEYVEAKKSSCILSSNLSGAGDIQRSTNTSGSDDTVQTATIPDEYKDRRSSRRVSTFLLPELAATHRRSSLLTSSRRTSQAIGRLPAVSNWLPITYYDHRMGLSDMSVRCRCCYNLSRHNRDPLVDNVSKIVFPVGFALFNVCYWSYYYLA